MVSISKVVDPKSPMPKLTRYMEIIYIEGNNGGDFIAITDLEMAE